MTPEKIAEVQARRASLVLQVEQLQAMLAPSKTLAAERDRAVAGLESALRSIDQLLGTNTPKRRPAKTAGQTVEREHVTELARIRKTDRAEVRVSIEAWKGRRTVDVRLWFVPVGTTEWRPSRKGVAIDASKLSALIDGLRLAEQHLQAPE